ncbi:hypothetical protein [Microvirga yunnanensis]|uniref:hypothetical protein n=1 Tax=Microvirga yunnanensis TaxID=2953740 RepID=UPI0021C6933C|nr:hypothetical protein [Microvirga sp. HBU65207]
MSKPKPPLVHAEKLVQEAGAFVYCYRRDTGDRPGPSNLTTFRRPETRLFRSDAPVRPITIRMERRFHGETDVNEHEWSR